MNTSEYDLPRERQTHLWRIVDQIRGEVPMNLGSIVEWFTAHGEHLELQDLVYIQSRLGKYAGGLATPLWLTSFIVKLLQARDETRFLDPIGGDGLFAAAVAGEMAESQVDVVTANPNASQLYEVIDEQVPNLVLGEFEEMQGQQNSKYDAIVTIPPIGVQREQREYFTQSGPVSVFGESSLLTVLDSYKLLSESGVMIFVVPPRFMWDARRDTVRKRLPDLGLHLSAVLNIRSGAFSSTNLSLDLVVIERAEYPSLFVGKIPENSNSQDQLVANLLARKAAKTPELGILVKASEYTGFEALIAQQKLAGFARSRGLHPTEFGSAVTVIRRPRRRRREFKHVDEHPDAVYLPEMASTPATTSLVALPERLKSYCQLIVDREIVLPEYLAKYLNTPMGQVYRDSTRTGSTISRINHVALGRSVLYLPPLSDQRCAVDALEKIDLLRIEQDELESRVWDRPRKCHEVIGAIAHINHEERFQDWLETLPFPLATILRSYHAIDSTEKERYERLLHFFEALAAFCATIHLSACRSVPQLWDPAVSKITTVLAEQNLSLSRPTFGLWRLVTGAFATEVRPLINGHTDDRTLCLEAYCLAYDEPLKALCSKALLRILDQANNYRNRWTGHGGYPSQIEIQKRFELTNGLLDDFRRCVGTVFTQYELVELGEASIREGPIFEYEARRVMGSNPILDRTIVRLTEPAVSEALFFHCPEHSKALKLDAFVQLRDEPQPACYFFNRVEDHTPHFVSYHSATISDIEDDSLMEMISGILAEFESVM